MIFLITWMLFGILVSCIIEFIASIRNSDYELTINSLCMIILLGSTFVPLLMLGFLIDLIGNLIVEPLATFCERFDKIVIFRKRRI